MNWQQVLDTQMDQLKWHSSSFGERFSISFFEQVLEKAGADVSIIIRDVVILERDVRIGLYRADTMFVTEEMQHVLLQAAHDLPDDAVYDPHMLLTPIGFVQLETPIYGVDRNGETLGVSAILWHESPITQGDDLLRSVFLYFFTDTSDEKDSINPYVVPLMREYGVPVPPLALVHFYPLVEGDILWRGEDIPGSELVSGLLKFFYTMNIIAHQTIGEPMKMRPDRAVRKRAQRVFENAQERMITLITLRRKSVKKDDGDKEPVPWSRRWVVRGHWRKQWYPSLKRHGWKYIYEYVKGPEDKPLIITERRVFNFRR